VIHEITSPDIHENIAVIEPTCERNCYTLTTIGMGAYCMDALSQFEEYKLDRAEMIICLSPHWKIMR